MPKSENRRASCLVRVTPVTLERLRREARRREVTMAQCVSDLLPGDVRSIGTCRYCKQTISAPNQKNRYHKELCPLWANKEPRLRRKDD